MTRRLQTHPPRRARALVAVTLGTLALFALGLQGCASPHEASVDPGETFEWLHQRDLSSFERQLAMERHHGQDNAWTRVGEAWLDLINCSGLGAEAERTEALEIVSNADRDSQLLAGLMYATVVLEIRRRNARIFDAESQATTLFSQFDTPDFFNRDPKPLPDHLIKWPGEKEAWIDEGLATVAIEDQCPKLRQNLLEVRKKQQKDQDTAASPEDERRRWLGDQLSAAEHIVTLGKRLPDELARGNIRLLLWRVRTHGAHVASTLGRPERGFGFVEPLSADTPGLDPGEPARMLFLRARLAADLDKPDTALSNLERALELGLGSPNAERARYLAVTLLTDQGRWTEALATGSPLPRRSSPLFEPMAYRLSLAARQVGDDKRFFRIAMAALADNAGASTPFRRAIYAQALDLLSTYEFDSRVVELVENLGPRNHVFDRLAELARVSLRRGYPQSAAASAKWLLRHHHNYRFAPKYHRLLAIAAFSRDDESSFRDNVHAMTRRSAQVIEAVGSERQAAFFADADREFARLMGQMLPAMAEWGDDAGASSRRQKWLTIIVEETQTFLRGVERSQVRPELLDLYRVASNLLEEHPRGYAERLGTKEPTPLVLGTVEVGHAELVESEPYVEPVMSTPFFLSLVPRTERPPHEWQFGWPAKDDRTPEKSTPDKSTPDEMEARHE